MLDVGLIGLGPEWEVRYRPALINLRHRMRVRVIQSAVGGLAEQMAAEWRCDPGQGLRAAMERSDVRALLILDTAWYGAVPAEFACQAGKPAFLAGRLGPWVSRAESLLPLAQQTDTPLMPDFGHRYTPATSRLKELVATRLGRPDEVIVEARMPPAASGSVDETDFLERRRDEWLAAIDWACHLIGTAPIEVRGSGTPQEAEEARIAFQQSASGGTPAAARVVLHHRPCASPEWSALVRCRKGTARLKGGTEIEWEDATEQRRESLSGERGGVEVMLDHFSRRVVGGLIPIPTLDDLCRAAQIAEAADKSRLSGKPVPIAAPGQ
jgi:predicted dehydrogenase